MLVASSIVRAKLPVQTMIRLNTRKTWTLALRYRAMVIVLAFAGITAGCSRDARLADQNLREDVKVHTLTAYGKVLDESASPAEVVYVFLRAAADDYAAGADHAAREKALDIEFGVCAAERIRQSDPRGAQVGETERNEHLYRVVHHWAPTFGHYRGSFVGEYETMAPRIREEINPAKPDESQVFVNMVNPSSDEPGNNGVVGWFKLAIESGFWRIYWVGFETSTRDWTVRPPKSSFATQRKRNSDS